MTTGPTAAKKKWPVKRIIVLSILIVLTLSGIYLYRNFNRLLSDALLKSFNSSVISDVYELKFENLNLNLFNGSIRVFNVSVLQREKPLNDYPYINSSFSLRTEDILLESVAIRTLLKENRLIVSRIHITKPEIEFFLNGKRHIMLPFKDTTLVSVENKGIAKRAIESFGLSEFQLQDASFHSLNSNKQREFHIEDLNISVQDLLIDQDLAEYQTSFSDATLSIGEFRGALKKDPLKHLSFEDFEIGIDSLDLHLTLDTLTYQFRNFHTNLHALDIQTADSLFHMTMRSFDLSYRDKSIKLTGMSFKPNVSHDVLQRKHRYQHQELSGSISRLNFIQVNFDSLIYSRKIFIDEITIDSVKLSLFKDKTKPMDSTRMPAYLGQTIRAIRKPLFIKRVKATHIHLDNTERRPDSTQASVSITRANLEVKNITNLAPQSNLIMSADAYINEKAHFKAGLTFQYSKPEFAFEGQVDKFNLPDLNPLIQAYTPAKINSGIADEISFTGAATENKATGTMKFLYHSLEVDLQLKNQAKWKSEVIAFAANTATESSNPGKADLPPRIVQFNIKRDRHKGFVNVVIKSILNGLKETMVMSKENRKTYKEEKKKAQTNTQD